MSKLEVRVREARTKFRALPYPKANQEYRQWREAEREMLEAERALALSRSEECALEWNLETKRDPVESPLLFRNAFRTVLLVPLHQKRATGGHARWAEFEEMPWAVLEFELCVSARLGSPNEEAIAHGHPLQGKGLACHGSHIIANSRWRAELEAVNSRHPGYEPARWKDLTHYFISFHDCTFECVARSYSLQKMKGSGVEIAARLGSELASEP